MTPPISWTLLLVVLPSIIFILYPLEVLSFQNVEKGGFLVVDDSEDWEEYDGRHPHVILASHLDESPDDELNSRLARSKEQFADSQTDSKLGKQAEFDHPSEATTESPSEETPQSQNADRPKPEAQTPAPVSTSNPTETELPQQHVTPQPDPVISTETSSNEQSQQQSTKSTPTESPASEEDETVDDSEEEGGSSPDYTVDLDTTGAAKESEPSISTRHSTVFNEETAITEATTEATIEQTTPAPQLSSSEQPPRPIHEQNLGEQVAGAVEEQVAVKTREETNISTPTPSPQEFEEQIKKETIRKSETYNEMRHPKAGPKDKYTFKDLDAEIERQMEMDSESSFDFTSLLTPGILISTLSVVVIGIMYQTMTSNQYQPIKLEVQQPAPPAATKEKSREEDKMKQESKLREMRLLEANKQLKKQLELAPLRLAINELKKEDLDKEIKQKKYLIAQYKLYEKLSEANESLVSRVHMDRYIRFKRLKNMIDLKTIPDKLHDLEWTAIFTRVRERMLEMEASIEFYQDQMHLHSNLLTQFEKTYKDWLAQIEEEKARGEQLQGEKTKLDFSLSVMS